MDQWGQLPQKSGLVVAKQYFLRLVLTLHPLSKSLCSCMFLSCRIVFAVLTMKLRTYRSLINHQTMDIARTCAGPSIPLNIVGTIASRTLRKFGIVERMDGTKCFQV